MAAPSSARDRRTVWLGVLLGAVLVVGLGQLFLFPFGRQLARWSYDVPFVLNSGSPPEGVTMVYVSPLVKRELSQPPDQPLDRRFYAQLLDRLTRDGARLVVFDILFDGPHAYPESDTVFAEAIRANRRVVLVGEHSLEFQGDRSFARPIPPIPALSEAAAAWGLANVLADSDQEVRSLSTGSEDVPAVAWVAASILNAETTRGPDAQRKERWLNYYCEPSALPAVNLDQVLKADGVPAGHFKDKIVVIGSRRDANVAGAVMDEFRTPFSVRKFSEQIEAKAPGASIQAFALLNLLRGDYLTRPSVAAEAILFSVWGLLVTFALMRLRPWPATLAAPVIFVVFAFAAIYAQTRYNTWFVWLIPAAVQTGAALVWSVGFQYVVENRRRRQLRRAFGAYLSPYMADQIADSEVDLALGGKEVEATILFTDLEGFTTMSESLSPQEVSHVLTSYFNETTRAIFEQDGTIIKYIGDAVMAAWNAPVADPRHAERAVIAAWGVIQSGQKEIAGRRWRTRIGINTGKVLAGNLGSDFRFDYTAIGDTTNSAARLEGLNKYIGTDILIGESTKAQLSNRITTRALGRFLMAGKRQPFAAYEVIGVDAPDSGKFPWLPVFETALRHFTAGKLEEAEKLFREVIRLRGSDGPSEFYLKEITALRTSKPDPDSPWDGVVVLSSK